MVGMKKWVLILFAILVLALPGFTQEEEEEESLFNFGMDFGLGVETIKEKAWQTMKLVPDIGIGPFGIGFDLKIHFTFTPDNEEQSFEIGTMDWVAQPKTDEDGNDIPLEVKDWIELYLAKILFVRWGQKGEPLFIKAGGIEDGTLGNGFIMRNYANTLFKPEKPIFGITAGVTGGLFNFPYVGVDAVLPNVAALNLFGVRPYVKPIKWLDLAPFNDFQIGYTMVMDTNPDHYSETPTLADDASVMFQGVDVNLPVLRTALFSMAISGDVAFDHNGHYGGMAGIGGNLLFFGYGLQFRMLGDNFVPTYFNRTYNLYSVSKYNSIKEEADVIAGHSKLFASLGTSFLENMVGLFAILDFPIEPVVAEGDPNDYLNYPHLEGHIWLAEGLVEGLSIEGIYDKINIRTLDDLISPADALIEAKINYGSGPALISLVYKVKYNPDAEEGEDPWEINSGIETSIQLPF